MISIRMKKKWFKLISAQSENMLKVIKQPLKSIAYLGSIKNQRALFGGWSIEKENGNLKIN